MPHRKRNDNISYVIVFMSLTTKVLGDRQAVPLEEVVLAQSFEREALLNVLERKGVIARAEVLEEIKRLRVEQLRGQ